MRKKLKIEIAGSVATGKSAFAVALFDLCLKHKISCTVIENQDDGDFETVAQDYEKRLDAVSEVIEVEIVTTQTRRTEKELMRELGYGDGK